MIVKMDAAGKDVVEIPEDKSAYAYGAAALAIVAATILGGLVYFL